MMRNIRTQVGSAHFHSKSGKWSVSFDSFVGEPGKEQLASVVRSGIVWDTEDEAYNAARRALDMLEQTGSFPNMCVRW